MEMELKIKQIDYSELRNIGNFNNKKLGVVVDVSPDQNPDDVLKEVKIYIQNQFDANEIEHTEFELKKLSIKYELLAAEHKNLLKIVNDSKEIKTLEAKLIFLRDKVKKIVSLIDNEEIKEDIVDLMDDDIPPF